MRRLSDVWLIAMKDLRLLVTDRGAVFFAILFPLLFITMFSLMGGAAEDERLELHLVSREAEGSLSHQIMAAMETKDDTQLKPGEPIIVWDRDYAAARRQVEQGELDGFVAFPEDFTEGVLMGYGSQLQVVADAEAVNSRAALSGLARAIASRVGAQQVGSHAVIGLLVEEGLSSGRIPDIGQAIEQIFVAQGEQDTGQPVIGFETEKVGEREPENASNWALPGYLVMFVFFTAALGAEAIVRERQNHTLERLLAGSVRRESILGGMFAGTAIKGLIQILIFWSAGILAFGTDLGTSPSAVILLSVLMVVMSSAFAIMLATLVRTQRGAGSLAVLVALVLAPVGGCWWPLFILPKWMQALAKITPHGWATTGFNKLMLFGADFGAVVPEMLVLVGFAVLFAVLAVWRFRTAAA